MLYLIMQEAGSATVKPTELRVMDAEDCTSYLIETAQLSPFYLELGALNSIDSWHK